MTDYMFGEAQFAEALECHGQQMGHFPQMMEAMSIDESILRATIGAMWASHKDAFKQQKPPRKLIYSAGLCDGIMIGLKLALTQSTDRKHTVSQAINTLMSASSAISSIERLFGDILGEGWQERAKALFEDDEPEAESGKADDATDDSPWHTFQCGRCGKEVTLRGISQSEADAVTNMAMRDALAHMPEGTKLEDMKPIAVCSGCAQIIAEEVASSDDALKLANGMIAVTEHDATVILTPDRL